MPRPLNFKRNSPLTLPDSSCPTLRARAGSLAEVPRIVGDFIERAIGDALEPQLRPDANRPSHDERPIGPAS
jgi:hypothetical protein